MSLTVLYSRCAGLDVHKKTVVACLLLTEALGRLTKEVRTFATTTKGNTHVQTVLAEVVWVISHTKDNYLSAQY